MRVRIEGAAWEPIQAPDSCAAASTLAVKYFEMTPSLLKLAEKDGLRFYVDDGEGIETFMVRAEVRWLVTAEREEQT